MGKRERRRKEDWARHSNMNAAATASGRRTRRPQPPAHAGQTAEVRTGGCCGRRGVTAVSKLAALLYGAPALSSSAGSYEGRVWVAGEALA